MVLAGKMRAWGSNESRLIKWIGVALFLIGFIDLSNFVLGYVLRYDSYFSMASRAQGIHYVAMHILPIFQGIRAITLIYMSSRVFKTLPRSIALDNTHSGYQKRKGYSTDIPENYDSYSRAT